MGMTLKCLRVNKGLTQREAAKAIGVSADTLSRYERAESFPDAMKIKKIEELYGTTYNDIIFLPETLV